MTQEEAREILIRAFVVTPDLPDDIKALVAQLVMPAVEPPKKKKRRWWR